MKSITIAAIWIIAGLILLISYGYSNWQGWDWGALDWQALGSFATWILAGGVFLAIWQVRKSEENTTKSANAQIAMDLFRQLRSDRALKIYQYIYNRPPIEDDKTLTPAHEDDIYHVLDRFDMLAILVDERIIDKRIAIEGYAGVTALRCWYQLHKYIWELRKTRIFFSENVEAFTNRCCQYFKNKDIKVGFTNPYTTPPIEDLVKKLLDAEKEQDVEKRNLYPRSIKEIKQARNQESNKDKRRA